MRYPEVHGKKDDKPQGHKSQQVTSHKPSGHKSQHATRHSMSQSLRVTGSTEC